MLSVVISAELIRVRLADRHNMSKNRRCWCCYFHAAESPLAGLVLDASSLFHALALLGVIAAIADASLLKLQQQRHHRRCIIEELMLKAMLADVLLLARSRQEAIRVIHTRQVSMSSVRCIELIDDKLRQQPRHKCLTRQYYTIKLQVFCITSFTAQISNMASQPAGHHLKICCIIGVFPRQSRQTRYRYLLMPILLKLHKYLTPEAILPYFIAASHSH